MYDCMFCLRWLLVLRILRSSQFGLILRVAWWKIIFFYYGRKNSVFSLFLPWNCFPQCWAIWLRSQFWILLEHLYIFKHKYQSNIKGAIFELRNSHLFRDQPYKEVLEMKCQACNFIIVLSFTGVFEDFCHIFLIYFL